MRFITKDSDYAVRALVCIAKSRDFVSAREISAKTKIPLPFLRRILRKLAEENIIESREGVSGGVRLKQNPHLIQLEKIVHIFQGDIKISDCLFRNKACPNRKTCTLRNKLKNIEKEIKKEFKKITIASLINNDYGGKNG
ncbi:MAG TPA: Rrf2 family transcriptional regulator [Candidatus Ratteibacteria bacterium]|jgi:Rrf2 family protein|nr:Rrf2 family transcriptional regulator [bacterium]HRS06779.1 Rrf2 family transcriptional regulator [Candidatus Ratteibacteria bacterium]HON06241.1 Rrf2 family transcriptional regulator [bacterium]HOQ81934.1 Rrf2 family transcriptional regulator [bacterium]HPC28938.1 Rrf2 family transcriptional regulator [bacterium]